jgi:hypothetical protein
MRLLLTHTPKPLQREQYGNLVKPTQIWTLRLVRKFPVCLILSYRTPAVLPPYLFGPFAEGFVPPPEPDFVNISTNIHIFQLLTTNGDLAAFPGRGYCDVRDNARAHVLAIKSTPVPPGGRPKRFLIFSPHALDFSQAVKVLASKRPELKHRLTEHPTPKFVSKHVPDAQQLEEGLGLKLGEFYKWENTVLDTVDSLLELERGWKLKGFTVAIPRLISTD